MFRAPIAAIVAIMAVLAIPGDAEARPSTNSHTCTDSQTMKIPLKELNRCALDGGSMKCTASGYQCCYDGGSYCEWSPYSARAAAGVDMVPQPGAYAQPPRPIRPDFQPPVGPKAPPMTPVPPRGPRFETGAGRMTVALPPRPTGPQVK
jgi:hypothetical protein